MHPRDFEGTAEGRVLLIPDYMQAGLYDYLTKHVEPGGFLLAVLSNDLCETYVRADGTNFFCVPAYVSYLYNHAPSQAWGSPEKVAAWLAAVES